jgi:hypothetical protein
MTGKSAKEGKKHPAAPTSVQSGVKTRANASAAVVSKGAKKTVKDRPEILTEDARYELARKAAEARIVRHEKRDQLRGKA